jgi:predicted DNA-binding protein
MAERIRVNVTLPPRVNQDLDWLAAEQTKLPAVLARELIEAGIRTLLEDPLVKRVYDRDRAGRSLQDDLTPDIVAALGTVGVPEVLAGHTQNASAEQLRVASWLVAVSNWLAYPQPESQKGPAPRLAEWTSLVLRNHDAGAALDLAGGADGLAVRQARQNGAPTVSDKRQLSDMGQPEERGRQGGRAY